MTPAQQAVLDYCRANPSHGHIRVANALSMSPMMAWKRMRLLHERGFLLSTAQRRQLLHLRETRRRLEEWKHRVGVAGHFPQTWGDVDAALECLSRIENQITTGEMK